MKIEDYQKVNGTYRKTLVFHFGAFAGFYSEYNNLIKAIAFCLVNKIKFKLYSKDAKICLGNGWDDYFEPFTEEVLDSIHSELNERFPKDRKQTVLFTVFLKRRIKRLLGRHATESTYHFLDLYIKNWGIKKRYGFDYFTFDVWNDIEGISLGQVVTVKNMFHGTYFQLLQQIDKMIYKFNDSTTKLIYELCHGIDLPDDYIGIHIRWGDKITEYNLIPLDNYVDCIKAIPDCKDVFVFTDSYEAIRQLKAIFPSHSFYTLCEENETGFYYDDLVSSDKNKIHIKMCRMFASIELLKRSRVFIGTASSNPYFPILLHKGNSKCILL